MTNEELLGNLIGLARSNPPGSDDQPKGPEADARAAVLARMMPKWRRIDDEARKAGEVLLWAEAWEGTWGIQTGQFDGSAWLTGEGRVGDNDPDFDPDAEVAVNEDYDVDGDDEANLGPTHWMPLPTPPEPVR